MEDIKQRFKEYFNSGKGGKIVIAILSAATVILLTVWGVLRMNLFREAPLPFDPIDSSQEGKYVSLEVIGVDDWCAVRGNEYYYVVQATDELLYLIQMTQDDFSSMQAQYEYWLIASSDDTDNPTAAPDPLIVTGYSTAFPDQLLQTVAETYEKSEEDMANYLGDYYLNTNMAASNQGIVALPVAAAVCALVAFILFFNEIQKKKNLERSLKRLESSGLLVDAFRELSAYGSDESKEGIILTDHYIFDKNSSSILQYRDIAWAYRHIVRRNFIEVNSFVVCCMRDKTRHQLMPFRNRKEVIDRTLMTIVQKNPDVLLGFTKENKARYSEMTKI